MVTTPLPAWPSFAFRHEPLNEGFKRDLADATVRSDMSQGPARQRSIFRNAPTTFTGQWAMTPDEFALFSAFQNVVGGGKFTVPVFADFDYVSVTANFVKGQVSATRNGGEWLVSAQIETMDKLVDSEAEYVIALCIFGYDGTIADFLGLFHTRVHFGWDGA